jgi:hypothetical protein
MIPQRAKQEVEALTLCGRGIELIDTNGQCYAIVAGIDAPAPPWNAARFDILIVIPALYSEASLDGFYIGLPYTYKNGTHERVNGTVIEVRGQKWQQVSWHYLDGKPWRQNLDSLETHIVHCRGFFLARGVKP